MPVVIEEFDSPALRGNPLGDPSKRKIPVYLPLSYQQEQDRKYPVVYLLHGFTGNSMMWLNTNMFYTPTVPERFERLTRENRCGEMILVLVDGYSALGGSQYVNSSATGNYEDFVVKDLVPFIDGKYRTRGRAVAGKSSGGFAALYLSMRHPDVFEACASHSGDMYFEYCYKNSFPGVVKGLASFLHTPDPVGAFLAAFAGAESKGNMIDTLEILALAACYSPIVVPDNPPEALAGTQGFELPFEIETGLLKPEVWQRWLAFDPVQMLEQPEYVSALQRMRGCYLDAGQRDEYNLDLGARIFTQKARQAGITVHHEEFDDGHRNISYRYDTSLPYLWRALTGAA